jgi:hypothetical protein
MSSAFPVIVGTDGVLAYQSGCSYQAGKYVERDLVIYKSTGQTSTSFIPSQWEPLFTPQNSKTFYVDANNTDGGIGTLFSPYQTIDAAVNTVIGSGSANAPEIQNATISVAGGTYSTGLNLAVKGLTYTFSAGVVINYTGSSYLFDNKVISSGDDRLVVNGRGTFQTETGGIIYSQGGGSNTRIIDFECVDIISTYHSNDDADVVPVIVSETSGSTINLNLIGQISSKTQHNIKVINNGSLYISKANRVYLNPTGSTTALPSQLVVGTAKIISVDETTFYSNFDTDSPGPPNPENIIHFTGGTVDEFKLNNVSFKANNKLPDDVIQANGLTIGSSFKITNSGFIGNVATTYFINANASLSGVELINVTTNRPNNNVTLSSKGFYNVIENQFRIDALSASTATDILVRESDGTIGVNPSAGGSSGVGTLQQVTDSGNTTNNQIVSTVTTGTAPFQVASTTKVNNLHVNNSTCFNSLNSSQFLRSDVADSKSAGNLSFPDSVCLTMGTGNDMSLFHNGVSNYVNSQSNTLYLNTDEFFVSVNGVDNAITARAGSCVELFYNDSSKFKTVTDGVCTTGIVYASVCGSAPDWVATSDARLKSNFENIEDPIELTMGLCGQKFDMLGTCSRQVGFVAQEVEKILPEVVSETEVNEGYYKTLGMDTVKGIKYDKIVPILAEAIKAQQKQIEELKNKITLLEKTNKLWQKKK